MQGKVAVITGGTSGIGLVTALQLARMGARIVLVARSQNRGEAALAQLCAAGAAAKHSVYYGDLSRLSEMRRVGREIAAAEPRIDILMNNAGAMFGQRQVTGDGLELTFALNHVAYFVMTHELRDRLVQSAPSRIVNTSSHAHYRQTLDFDDLQSERDYKGFPVYCRSKVCNILFTRALAKRLTGAGVTANSFHPGFVKTRFGNESGGSTARWIRLLKIFAISEEKGADTMIYLASSNDVAQTTGRYFYKREEVEPSKQAQDDESAERLWQETAKLAGIAR